MSKEKDKDLDDLFKKRLDDPVDPVGFEEKDWDAMEQMLDKQKRRGVIYWLPILSSVAALFLMFLGWLMFIPKNKVVVSKNRLETVNHFPHSKNDTLKNIVQRKIAQTTINTPSAAPSALPKPNTASQKINSLPYIAHNSRLSSNKTPYKTGNNADNNGTFAVRAPAEKPESIASENDHLNNAAILDTGRNIQLLASSAPVYEMEPGIITAEPIKTTLIPKAAYKRVAEEMANGKIKVTGDQGFRPQYAISVLGAPDVNGVGSFQNSKVGTNVGLLFSAGVSKKFTVSTGALYSVKPYLTGFENYHTNYVFKTNPVSVLANCHMLDIPLNLGYSLYNKHQNQFSIGTGLSSYIMLHQLYTFNYASATTPGPEYFNVAHSSGYYFGILNLNATYQRQLNSKVGFSVMPYLKLPLTNIGYSQVKLQTTGISLGLSWNLNTLSR